MAGKFAQLKQIVDGYEDLWGATYFEGVGDYGNYYNYDTTIINYSAFDANGIRDYLRDGGNSFTLLSSLQELAEYSAANEAIAKDLMAQIQMLDIEMGALLGGGLDDYATAKGKTLKTTYSFRNELFGFKWIRLENNTYFNLHDIEYIMSAVSGETEMFELMKDYRSELLGYLGASSVNTVKVSNRMYDIYKYASRVYDLYNSSFYNESLMTDGQRTELLNLYQDSSGENNIQDTLYQITSKHSRTAYYYNNLPSDNETDFYTPLGKFADPTLAEDRVSMTAPLYHPFASSVTNAEATVSVYGENGWEPLSLDTGSSLQPMTIEENDGRYLSSDSKLGLFGTNNAVEVVIDKENDTITLYAKGLENNKEYKFDWNITYAYDGTTQSESDDIIKTITYEPTVVAKAVLQEDSSTTAIVTVTNLTGSILSGNYVYVDGYGENGELIASAGAALDTLGAMETSEMILTLNKPLYTVFAYVEDEQSIAPTSLIIKKDGAEASNIFVKPSSTLQYTAEVFDPMGNPLSGENVVWSVSPLGNGVNVENGTVIIGEVSSTGIYTITASAGGAAFDEIILTIEDSTPQSKLIYNGLTKNGALITGGLTLQIVNDNPELESCDIMIAVYEKDKNKLGDIITIRKPLNQGINEINIDDLSFDVDSGKTYEVRIFSWMTQSSLKPVTGVFRADL